MAFHHGQSTYPTKSYSYPGDTFTSCHPPASPLRMRSRAKVDRRSHTSDSADSCAMRDNVPEDCPHARFVNWLVRGRQNNTQLSKRQRNECPMPLCRGRVFPNLDELLGHLLKCEQVADGRYYCWTCDRIEEFPLGNCRSCRCQWVHPPKSLRDTVKQVKKGVKKAIINPSWMSPRGGRRSPKPEEYSAPSPTLPAPALDPFFTELTGEGITPELLASVPADLDVLGLPPQLASRELYEMADDFTTYPAVCPQAQADPSGRPVGHPNYYGLARPPQFSQSTVSSMGSSGSGSWSSVSRVSPQTTMDSSPRQFPSLSIDTSVGGTPAWTNSPCFYSPTEIEDQGNMEHLQNPQRKQHSWGSETTYVGSTDSMNPHLGHYEPKFETSELEGSIPQGQLPAEPQEMAGTDFTGEHAAAPVSTEDFFPSLQASQSTMPDTFHSFAHPAEPQHLQQLDYFAGEQSQMPTQYNQMFTDAPAETYPVGTEGGLNRAFSFQGTPDESHAAFAFPQANTAFNAEYLATPNPPVPVQARTRPAPKRQKRVVLPHWDHVGHVNFVDESPQAPRFPATPPQDSSASTSLPIAPRPTPSNKPPKQASRSRSRSKTAKKRPAGSPSPSPPPTPRQTPSTPAGKRSRPAATAKCSDCDYSPVGPDRHKLVRRHKQSKHSDEPQIWECDFVMADGTRCGRTYTNRRDNLVQHQQREGHRPVDSCTGTSPDNAGAAAGLAAATAATTAAGGRRNVKGRC